MNTLKIPDALEAKYAGCGFALAAVSLDGKSLIDFRYCRDIDDSFDEDSSPDEAAARIANSERFKAFGEFFEVAGHSRMTFGMVSCWEFVEL